MSTKEIVQDLLQKLPEDVSLHDVAQEIEFVAAVRQGLAEIDRGERIPIEEIERELPSWVIRYPSHLPLDVDVARFWHGARGTPKMDEV
jgi:hypothetical protein